MKIKIQRKGEMKFQDKINSCLHRVEYKFKLIIYLARQETQEISSVIQPNAEVFQRYVQKSTKLELSRVFNYLNQKTSQIRSIIRLSKPNMNITKVLFCRQCNERSRSVRTEVSGSRSLVKKEEVKVKGRGPSICAVGR